jgi:acetoin utilization deacetylase AcuC-like enzyme
MTQADTPRFYFPDAPDIPLPPGHRFPAAKYRLLREAAIRDDVLSPKMLAPSPLIGRSKLVSIHSEAYVDAILTGTLDQKAVRQLGLPLSDVLCCRSLATVGGSLAAARRALRTGFSAQLAGGTHHAHRDFGSGFCVFNDLALTARVLLDDGAVDRIAILDCDVHQGDGTAALMADEPRVLTVDVFGQKNFPVRKVAADVDIALPDATGDDSYLASLDAALEQVFAFRPGLLLYNAGVDPLAEDRLGRLSLTLEGLWRRDSRVFEAARDKATPVVSVAGGGYAEPLSLTVTAYLNTLKALCEANGL